MTMTKEQEKEIVLECMDLIVKGWRQIVDAQERLESMGIQFVNGSMSISSSPKLKTKHDCHVYKGIGKLAEYMGKETFNPPIGVFEDKPDDSKLAFVMDDFLVFELGKKSGYKFP